MQMRGNVSLLFAAADVVTQTPRVVNKSAQHLRKGGVFYDYAHFSRFITLVLAIYANKVHRFPLEMNDVLLSAMGMFALTPQHLEASLVETLLEQWSSRVIFSIFKTIVKTKMHRCVKN